MTPAHAEKTFVDQLKSLYDKEEAKGLAFYVIHHFSGIHKSDFLLKRNEPIAGIDQTTLVRIIKELKAGKPVQYILGETEFYGLTFKVNPSVLIPRPETEELVDWVIKEVGRLEAGDGRRKPEVGSPKSLPALTLGRKQQEGEIHARPPVPVRAGADQIRTILDIGTGSGCIAIALKNLLPKAKVSGLDISANALETARQNALLNNSEIEFFQADILKDLLPDAKYSIIISNPPYVTLAEKEQMHINVTANEPHEALFVPDDAPMIFYEHIIDFASTHLSSQGLLFLEINEKYSREIIELLNQKGFSDAELRKDLQGKDRMIKARI